MAEGNGKRINLWAVLLSVAIAGVGFMIPDRINLGSTLSTHAAQITALQNELQRLRDRYDAHVIELANLISENKQFIEQVQLLTEQNSRLLGIIRKR